MAFNSVTLAKGDTVEAVVGVGTSNAYQGDRTVFTLTVKEAGVPPAVSEIHQQWSVVGRWNCEEPQWKDTVTISADGTFVRDQERDAGRWSLAVQQDHIVLILAWDHWPAEIVTLMEPEQFSSPTLTMKRVQETATVPPDSSSGDQ